MKRLTPTERYFLDFMENNIDSLSDLSITKLSEKANVSTTTIFRTVKKLGFNGFSEYKLKLMEQKKDNHYYKMVKDGDDIKKIILKNQQEVNNTINMIDYQLIDDALNYLYESNCIYIFSRGLSEQIGYEMQIKFNILNKRCELYTDPNIIRKISHRATKNDCVVYISLIGETKELVDAAKITNHKEVPSIMITTRSDSSLAKYCDIILEGYKSDSTYFTDYEIRSRLPLNVISRILLDSYSNKFNKNN